MADDAAPRERGASAGKRASTEGRGAAEAVNAPPITDDDLYLFNEGSHYHLYHKLGCHLTTLNGIAGATFAVWAPNANYVSVIGDFNGWNRATNKLAPRGPSGIWEGFVGGVRKGHTYKFHIGSRQRGFRVDKADPFGIHHETPPRTGSKVWDLDYDWGDAAWMAGRGARNALASPISIYEVHLGSWMRVPEDGYRSLSYRELAEKLVPYVADLGFTHVEFLPVMEHPFYGSWGYQTTGYFAPTSRYGTPQDFMYLVDRLHQAGIGVILDWVPSHFPTDEHALAYFDGTHLFEHADMRQGFHPDWNSYIFNYGRHEVRSFLLSSAFLWLDVYHADGLRVDAVASMLYLDYSRKPGEWIPNRFGGHENLEAVDFIRRFNAAVYERHPDTQTIAEESTAWPMVSRPTYVGGLGFGLKWDMGWMHDTLRYLSKDPVHRRFHHNDLTFRGLYAFTENYCLPLSHDEVVHGKGSLLARMPGDGWQQFANLRALLGYMYSQPGKKLLFMGGEIAQGGEWSHESSVEWHLLERAPHQGVQRLARDLNRLLRAEPALHELDSDPAGMEWIDANDSDNSVLTYLRMSRGAKDVIVVACNFTPVPRPGYRVGVPRAGYWREVLNTDAWEYGGSGQGNLGGRSTDPIPFHGRAQSLDLVLPPLAVVALRHEAG
ncbi:MAG TPA: 1,4-alpha-glucan branching protein GlgB [Gemmatimonadales bacterium]|nr:1,4-alpha-glucan branching protein GlgB [Gemmatimonadales bacterium]